jgi:MSHA biogenesis protein MshL
VELTPFFSGIALDVTPQIDEEGKVLLHIHPSVIDTEEQSNHRLGTTDPGPAAGQELDPRVGYRGAGQQRRHHRHRRSDEDRQAGDRQQGAAAGGHSWVGEAFTNRRESTKKVELVILLKPTVVEKDTWQKSCNAPPSCSTNGIPPRADRDDAC